MLILGNNIKYKAFIVTVKNKKYILINFRLKYLIILKKLSFFLFKTAKKKSNEIKYVGTRIVQKFIELKKIL